MKDRNQIIERYRNKVLSALDEAARETHGYVCKMVQDGDLPELFETIDALAEKIAWRNGVSLDEDQSEFGFDEWVDALVNVPQEDFDAGIDALDNTPELNGFVRAMGRRHTVCGTRADEGEQYAKDAGRDAGYYEQ